MTADGPNKCHWTVDLAFVYVSSVNGILRGLIERGDAGCLRAVSLSFGESPAGTKVARTAGATGGITKNFEQITAIMRTFTGAAEGAEDVALPAVRQTLAAELP